LNRSREDHRTAQCSIFTHDYSGYRPDSKYVEAMTGLATRELLTRVSPPARVLDIGCGAGDFLAIAETLGYSAEGIDISQASADICRARGLNAQAGDFLSHPYDSQVDVITMWDVIAHLEDPAAFLDRARSLLTIRGKLFIKTPGFGHLTVEIANRWPRTAGTLVGAPSHCQYFNRSSLSALLTRTGFAPQWIGAGSARSSRAAGSLKRRLARRFRSAISHLSGDSNLYLVAHPAR
jgi:2-polyprenyl-3-methyl-5-hydroxy-6-metoxy-1,4-benzoquinol methylase